MDKTHELFIQFAENFKTICKRELPDIIAFKTVNHGGTVNTEIVFNGIEVGYFNQADCMRYIEENKCSMDDTMTAIRRYLGTKAYSLPQQEYETREEYTSKRNYVEDTAYYYLLGIYTNKIFSGGIENE